jgi:hypothetical protein
MRERVSWIETGLADSLRYRLRRDHRAFGGGAKPSPVMMLRRVSERSEGACYFVDCTLYELAAR